MRKVFLSVIGFSMICRLSSHAQTHTDSLSSKPAPSLYTPVERTDSTGYNPRALKLEEINLVSSSYWQTGDHSAVQGGIGSEQVTDIANGIDLKFVWGDPNYKKNSITLGMGYDHHTAASQAWVSST